MKKKIKCLECDEYVANSNNVLSRHLKKEHKISWSDYVFKYKLYVQDAGQEEIVFNSNGKAVCRCGCGTNLKVHKGLRAYPYLDGHRPMSGSNNPMYGLKGNDSPNYGKKRTKEHRDNYRKSAFKRYKDNPELIDQIRDLTIKRNESGEFGNNSFKKEYVYNKFFEREELMDSSWEKIYYEKCVERNIKVTKKHGFKISYKDPFNNFKRRIHIPDFYLPQENTIVEIKGYPSQLSTIKMEYAQRWCERKGWDYKVLSYDKSSDCFYEMGYFDGIYGNIEEEYYGSYKKVLFYSGKRLNKKRLSGAFFNKDQKEIISYYLLGYFRKYGFPYPKYSKEELLLDYDKVCNTKVNLETDDNNIILLNNTRNGNKIFYHFNPHYFSAKTNKDISMIDAFNDDEILLSVIKNRLGIIYKESFNITGAMIRQGMKSTYSYGNVSIFNTNIAKYLYENYCPENGTVYDYSAGFGQRFVGCMATNKNIRYVGCDPLKNNIDSINNIADFLGHKNNLELYCIGSEDFMPQKYKSKINFSFSSPPYFDKEIYSDETSQAYSGKSYNSFINDWWGRVCQNIKFMLKKDGIFAVNVSKKYDDKNFAEDIKNKALEYGFILYKTIYIKNSISHLHKQNLKKNLEPIMLFKVYD